MARADERRDSTSAETAGALLAYYRVLQSIWRDGGRGSPADCAGDGLLSRIDVSDRGPIGRTLAGFFGRPNPSLLLRQFFAGTHRNAGAGVQRVYRWFDLLRGARV